MSKPDQRKSYWPIEGAAHDDVSRGAIYVDSNIASFLDYDRQPIIIASKGMGKTLLLRSKKKVLEDRREGKLIIPRGLEYDEPKIFGDIPRSYAGFRKVAFWTDLWRASILFSIFSHGYGHLLAPSPDGTSHERDQHTHENLVKDYVNQLATEDTFRIPLLSDIERSASNNPSHYLGELLCRGLSSAEKLRRNAHVLKSMSERLIHNGVYLFIDAFDQTLTEHFGDDLDVWKSAQVGLVLASHYLNTENHHIKVYASIRQEAFAGYRGDHSEVIRGKALQLEYDQEDLRRMFLKGVDQYSHLSTIEGLVGLSAVHNDVFNVDENPFSYIYRHSSGTPRSVMYFGQVLAKLGADGSEVERSKKVKDTVNRIAAQNILDDYLKGQRAIFLTSLREDAAVRQFLGLVCSNVLNARAMGAISKEFAKTRGTPTAELHPFCELFNIGLLGTHRADPVTLKLVQFFRRPHQFDWQQQHIIKPESVYFLHPALHAELIDGNPKYRINKRCLIGVDYPWPGAGSGPLFPLLFISYSSLDKDAVQECLPALDYQLCLLCPHEIWYDRWKIKPGQNIHQAVEKGVEGSDIVLIFLSKNSLESGWVEKEWRLKHVSEIESGHISVIGVLIDDTDFKAIPAFLRDKKVLRLPTGDKADKAAFEESIRELAEGIFAAVDGRRA